jgi:hypothetical protein
MGKTTRKKVALFFAICGAVLAGLWSGTVARADGTVTQYNVTSESQFTCVNGVITAFTGDKETETIVIPLKVSGQEVKGIGDNVFADYEKVSVVVMPETVTSFGSKAFANCKSLNTIVTYNALTDGKVEILNTDKGKVHLPAGFQSFSSDALLSCYAISNFVVPEENTTFKMASTNAGQTEQGELLLSKDGTKLYRMAPAGINGKYYIPEGITEICDYSLEGNMGGGREYVVPTSVTTIGGYAFYGCGNLNSVEFAEVSKLTTIGAFAFAKNSNLRTNGHAFTLPESVTTIGESCFKDCVNMEIDLSKTSITTIPQYIFDGCQNIHAVTLPKTLKYLEAYAFYNCANLNNVYFLGDSLEKVGTGAFQYCNNLHEIEIPEGVTEIENDTFDGCQNLNKIVLPDSLEKIGDNAFKDCQNIHEMVIPANVKYISNTSFTGAKQDEIDTSKNEYAQSIVGGLPKVGDTVVVKGVIYKITKSAEKNGTAAVSGVESKKITSAAIQDTVKKGGYTFKVTEISKNALKKCTRLKSVTIGKNVTKIGANAFYGDKKLKKITIKSAKLKSVGKNAIKNVNKKAVIKVPKKQLKKYKKLFKGKTGYKKTMKIRK